MAVLLVLVRTVKKRRRENALRDVMHSERAVESVGCQVSAATVSRLVRERSEKLVETGSTE
jgi:hypothetical protein